MKAKAYKFKPSALIWGPGLAFAALVSGPVVYLFINAFLKLFTQNDFKVPSINLRLFMSSMGLSLQSTLLCAVLGLFTAFYIWGFKYRKASVILNMLLISALIPHFIHVHSWIKVIDFINLLINRYTGLHPNFTGKSAVIITTAFSYLPFTTAFTLLGLMSIPSEIVDVIRLQGNKFLTWTKIIFPYILPFILTGIIFIFLLSINDFGIPSVFGVSVYALELFALFSAGRNMYSIALSSLPLVLLSLALLILFGFLASKTDFNDDFSKTQSPFGRPLAGALTLLLFIGVPLIAMIVESFKAAEILNVIRNSTGQIFYALSISLLTAVFAVLPAAVYSFRRASAKRKSKTPVFFALPFLIPSAITGLSMIAFWNMPFLSNIYRSAIMPAIGLSSRFTILAILFMSYRFSRIDPGITESLKFEFHAGKGFFRAILPMMVKDIAACILLVFALAMGDYGIVLLITPPGYQMITIKIYNYIHFGATEIVFALNTVILISVLLAGAAITLFYRGRDAKS